MPPDLNSLVDLGVSTEISADFGSGTVDTSMGMPEESSSTPASSGPSFDWSSFLTNLMTVGTTVFTTYENAQVRTAAAASGGSAANYAATYGATGYPSMPASYSSGGSVSVSGNANISGNQQLVKYALIGGAVLIGGVLLYKFAKR